MDCPGRGSDYARVNRSQRKENRRNQELETTSPEIQIRRAAPEDAPSVAKVLHDSFVEFEALYTPKGFAATTPNAEQILIRMRKGPVWIAVRGIEVLGTVAAAVKQESLYMRGMAVIPAARGLSVGARLLAQVESCALSEGCSRIFLSTTPFLKAAIQLYERSGFLRTEDEPHDLFGTPLFTMEKNIAVKA
jgi:GNAT superfamily N-acetyltransferase